MGGTLTKLLVGAFFVGLSSQMGELARDVISRARESVQASEMLTLDGALAAWAIEQRRTRGPRDQEEFNQILEFNLSARGGRDVTKDRWDRPYVYEHLSDRPIRWRVSSRGPDLRLGTEDDLVVERTGDRSELSRDPVEIIERALESTRRRYRQTLADLRMEVKKQKGKSGDVGKELLDAGAHERAELEQSLDHLDSLLN